MTQGLRGYRQAYRPDIEAKARIVEAQAKGREAARLEHSKNETLDAVEAYAEELLREVAVGRSGAGATESDRRQEMIADRILELIRGGAR